MISIMRWRHFAPLENLLLAFFLLPVLFFLIGWFNDLVAIPSALGLVLVFYRALTPDTENNEGGRLSFGEGAAIFIIVLLWVSLSGTGGIGYQNWDHVKHNAMMNDLVRNGWPLRYQQAEALLVYYVPFYLIPAFLGKLFGWAIGNLFLWLQLFLLVLLALSWIVKTLKAHGAQVPLVILLFIFASGNDWVGQVLTTGVPDFFTLLEGWTYFQYSSITAQLFWVPNSFLAALVGTILFIDALNRASLLRAVLAVVLTFFWCPYVALGLVPFFLAFISAVTAWRRLLHDEWKWIVLTCPAAILALLFYSAKSQSFGSLPIWKTYTTSFLGFAFDYARFLLLEVLWAVPFICYFRRKKLVPDDSWRMFLIAVGALTVIPLMSAPGIADFIMKASMPALCVFFLVIIQTVKSFFEMSRDTYRREGLGEGRWMMLVLIAVLLSGSLTAAYEIGRGIKYYKCRVPEFIPADRVPALQPDSVAAQYLGKPSPLLKHLLRPSGQQAQ